MSEIGGELVRRMKRFAEGGRRDVRRCDSCEDAPRWIYRIGEEEICGACCVKLLAEERQENAKLREELLSVSAEADELRLRVVELEEQLNDVTARLQGYEHGNDQ